MNNKELTISWETILKVCLTVLVLYILYILKDIIIWFIFALIIAVLFNYLIDFLEKKRIPRSLTTPVLYISIFALAGLFVYKTAPLFLSELEDFSQNLPQHLKRISPLFEQFGIQVFQSTETLITALQTTLSKAQQNIFQALFSIFGGAFSSLFVIFLAFFLSLEKNLPGRLLASFSSKKQQQYFSTIWEKSRQKVSGWFISRLTGALFVALTSYISLELLNIKYAFVISVIAGLLDFIPLIGPLVATALAMLIAALNNWLQAFFVLAVFGLIQILENHLVVPILFQRFVGLPPVLTLLSFAVGARLWGALGAVLTIPLVGVIYEITKDYLKQRKKQASSSFD